jgi:hypothetical protein
LSIGRRAFSGMNQRTSLQPSRQVARREQPPSDRLNDGPDRVRYSDTVQAN